MKLYVYDHCPFCVRPRMLLGFKHIDAELITLLNDDETTPISFVGAKLVPILQKQDESYMKESLDIVDYLDHLDAPILEMHKNPHLHELISQLDQSAFRRLTSPRHVLLPLKEFATQSARDYFINKKSQALGDFNDCIKNTKADLAEIMPILTQIDVILATKDFEVLSIDDIISFPFLRNLTVVKEIRFAPATLNYIHKIATKCNINLYFDDAI